MTVSIGWERNSLRLLETLRRMSIPISALARIASGWTKPAGRDPSLSGSRISPAAALRIPSAIWLRQELPVHRMRIFGFKQVNLSKVLPVSLLGETTTGTASLPCTDRFPQAGPCSRKKTGSSSQGMTVRTRGIFRIRYNSRITRVLQLQSVPNRNWKSVGQSKSDPIRHLPEIYCVIYENKTTGTDFCQA